MLVLMFNPKEIKAPPVVAVGPSPPEVDDLELARRVRALDDLRIGRSKLKVAPDLSIPSRSDGQGSPGIKI